MLGDFRKMVKQTVKYNHSEETILSLIKFTKNDKKQIAFSRYLTTLIRDNKMVFSEML